MFAAKDAEAARSRYDSLVWLCAVGALLALMGFLVNRASYNDFAAFVTLVALVAVSFPVLLWVARDDPALGRLYCAGFVAKMLATPVRYYSTYVLYGGVGDAAAYDRNGWKFAQEFSLTNLSPRIDFLEQTEDATRRISKLTGYIYVIVGHSQFAGFFIFSFGAFVGTMLLLRAAHWGIPEHNHRRLAAFVLFLPSMLFWPTGLGKDATMVFLLGLAAYGSGLLLAPRARLIGVLPFAAGLLGMTQIRSHVALMAVLSVSLAFAFAVLGGKNLSSRVTRDRVALSSAIAGRVVVLVIMLVASVYTVSRTASFFTNSAQEADSTGEALDGTVDQTQTGGSAFDPIRISSPVNFVPGAVSVILRPFPWEVNSANTAIAGGEGVIMAVLFVASRRQLRELGRAMWHRPFVSFCVVYIALFVTGFSSIANFGILARQRTQMLLFLMVCCALPVGRRWWESQPEPIDDTADGPARRLARRLRRSPEQARPLGRRGVDATDVGASPEAERAAAGRTTAGSAR